MSPLPLAQQQLLLRLLLRLKLLLQQPRHALQLLMMLCQLLADLLQRMCWRCVLLLLLLVLSDQTWLTQCGWGAWPLECPPVALHAASCPAHLTAAQEKGRTVNIVRPCMGGFELVQWVYLIRRCYWLLVRNCHAAAQD